MIMMFMQPYIWNIVVFQKWVAWSLEYWRSFQTGINFFGNKDITSYLSFSMLRQKKTLQMQICAAIVKLTLSFCIVCFQHYIVYHSFHDVISDQFCPYLLFDILWFIGMKIAQSNHVFQLSKKGFDSQPWNVRHFYI